MDALTVERVALMLCVAAVVALLARRVKLPYTIGLIFAGAVLSLFDFMVGVPVTKELLYRALLPPLIFEAAFFIHWDELRKDLAPVLTFATLGTVLSAAVIAAALTFVAHWPWPVSLVFGSLIAATDPVSVIALFKELKVEGRLRVMMESESLVNDGAAAVLFGLSLTIAMGAQLTVPQAGLTLIREVGGGIACGALVAGLSLWLVGRTQEHLVEILFTVVSAFGSFLLAEHFHCSGVLATLTAGLMIGNMGPTFVSDQGRIATEAFWEFAAFVSNSIIFLLIGVRETALGGLLMAQLPVVAVAVLATLVARAVTIYGLATFFSRGHLAVPVPHQHVLIWGGLKGALSWALVLGLPENFPLREQVTAAAFGVVTFSVVAQGASISLVMKRLGLLPAPDARSAA